MIYIQVNKVGPLYEILAPISLSSKGSGKSSKIHRLAKALAAHIRWNQPLPYIEGLLFMDFDNGTLTSRKPCQHSSKFDCRVTNSCNIPQ